MCCIVLDLEWNQPFSTRSMVTTPVRLPGEIIQIGAVKLNERLEIVDTFKVMVKPKYYPHMHRKIARLTQISNADLAYGFPFKQALAYFTAWCPEDAVFLTWGTKTSRSCTRIYPFIKSKVIICRRRMMFSGRSAGKL